MRQLTLLLAVLTASLLVLTAAPTLAAEATITVRACVLDTEAGSNAARAAEAAIGNGPATQVLNDGLVQVWREVGTASTSTSKRITIEFVAN